MLGEQGIGDWLVSRSPSCLVLPQLSTQIHCQPAGLYYEELEWGHGAPGWRCLAAGTLELAYVLGSAGEAAWHGECLGLLAGPAGACPCLRIAAARLCLANLCTQCLPPLPLAAGAGVPVSLALRCSGRRQSVGELLAGVRVVREVQSTAQLEGGEQ